MIEGAHLRQAAARARPQPESNPQISVPTNGPVIVAVANAKGGVGKTSIVANLAGLSAAHGWRVLAIDLDPQGNLVTDLGCKDRSDRGAGLADVLRGGGPVVPITEARPGLDVWPGGPALSSIVPGALIPMADNPLGAAVQETGDRYDLVLVDCPPTLGPLVDAGLSVARLLIVPIRADHASLDGLTLIGDRIRAIRQRNDQLELLGVVLFDISRTATALVRDVAAALARDLAGLDPRPLPAIRRSERSAYEMRKTGRLAHEYAAGRAPDSPAAHLAADYAALAEPFFARLDALTARV